MATWGPEPRGQAVRPSATNAAFRDAAASWFEAGLCMGRVFRTWGAGRAAPLPVAAVASASAPLGLGRPPPRPGPTTSPWKAGESGAGEPGQEGVQPPPQATRALGPPVGEDPAPGREGSELPDSLQSPRGSGGKTSEMAASPPPHPSGEKAFVTPTGSPRAALGERGTGISPALGGAWHMGPERDRQQGRARLVHRAGVGGWGGPRAPADDPEGPGQLKPRCQGS